MTVAAAFVFTVFFQTLIDRPDSSEGGYCIFDCTQGSEENYSNYHSDTDYKYASPHLMPLSALLVTIRHSATTEMGAYLHVRSPQTQSNWCLWNTDDTQAL